MSGVLRVIQEEVRERCEETAKTAGDWPCRRGCDECCRRLAAVPTITNEEWGLVRTQLAMLPPKMAEAIRERIRASESDKQGPHVCPMLDKDAGACAVYGARPMACRVYGFYVERRDVLGCERIRRLAEQDTGVVWGNSAGVTEKMRGLGQTRPLYEWLASEGHEFGAPAVEL